MDSLSDDDDDNSLARRKSSAPMAWEFSSDVTNLAVYTPVFSSISRVPPSDDKFSEINSNYTDVASSSGRI